MSKIYIERIKDYLVKENISLKQFAKQVRVSLLTLVMWLNSKKEPKLIHLKKTAQAMNCTIDYLCGISDDPLKNMHGEVVIHVSKIEN